ncbi:uncharacterized protein L201_007436 [Kwoniella dendrophila CBS 6074]|uniref:F-box domain-containing protein n=1 Tax=Kwoniella dendrophila CBS 6074 TaxID=1295534 RepID=A0AAX4K5W3_9TREE
MTPRAKQPRTVTPKRTLPNRDATKKSTLPPTPISLAAKKASTARKSGRKPLKQHKANEAISEDESEVTAKKDKKGKAKVKRAPILSPFSDEILKTVLGFCLEDQVEGCYVAQRTLASAIRVNSTFYKIAGLILYEPPNVIDVESFFLGSLRKKKEEEWDTIEVMNPVPVSLDDGKKWTKQNLFDHTKHIKILSCLVPRYYENGIKKEISNHYIKGLIKDERFNPKDIEIDPNEPEMVTYYRNDHKTGAKILVEYPKHKYQKTGFKRRAAENKNLSKIIKRGNDIYEKTSNILTDEKLLLNEKNYPHGSRLHLNLTPNLISIEIGSLSKISYKDQNLKGDLMKDLIKLEIKFGKGIEKLKLSLWNKLKPFEWCEYQPELIDLFRPPELQSLIGPRYDQYVPQFYTMHLNLLEPFSIIWGSTNRVVLRKYTKDDWQWRKKRRRILKHLLQPSWQIEWKNNLFGEVGINNENDINNEDEDDEDEDDFSMHNYQTGENLLYYDDIKRFNKFDTIDVLHNTIRDSHPIKFRYQKKLDYLWRHRLSKLKDFMEDPKVDCSYIKEQIEDAGFEVDFNNIETARSPSLMPFSDDDIEDPGQSQDENENANACKEREKLQKAKIQYWLNFRDVEMIIKLQKDFRYNNRTWTNSDDDDASGPMIRFEPLEDLPKCGKTVLQHVNENGSLISDDDMWI